MNWFKKLYRRWLLKNEIRQLKENNNKRTKEYYARIERQLGKLVDEMNGKKAPAYCLVTFSSLNVSNIFAALRKLTKNLEQKTAYVPLLGVAEQRQLKGWLVDESNNMLDMVSSIKALNGLVKRCNVTIKKNNTSVIENNLYGYEPVWDDIDSFILSCYERLLKECS